MKFEKLDTFKFALTAGIYLAVCAALATVASLYGVPGFVELTRILASFYGFWGYSISWFGVFTGAIWGFIEGFVHFGIFAWLYNKLLR